MPGVAEMMKIIREAEEKSDSARRALAECKAYTQQVKHEQDTLMAASQILLEEWDIQPDRLANSVSADLQISREITAALASCAPGEGVSYAIKTHKMHEILIGAERLLSKESDPWRVAYGNLPASYNNALPEAGIPLFGVSPFYGTSACSYLSAALVEIQLNLLGKESRIADIRLPQYPSPWFSRSAIACWDRLPSIVPYFPDYRFGYQDGMAWIHSGYAFGGTRQAATLLHKAPHNVFAPHDCSSWAAQFSGCHYSFTTVDLLKSYNYATGLGYQSKEEQLTREAEDILGQLTPVDVRHVADVVPGTWMAFRTFNSEKTPDNSYGTSGHVVMVLGPGSDNKVVTLGYSRDMPVKEGFGVESFPIINDNATRTLFFQKKNVDEGAGAGSSIRLMYNK